MAVVGSPPLATMTSSIWSSGTPMFLKASLSALGSGVAAGVGVGAGWRKGETGGRARPEVNCEIKEFSSGGTPEPLKAASRDSKGLVWAEGLSGTESCLAKSETDWKMLPRSSWGAAAARAAEGDDDEGPKLAGRSALSEGMWWWIIRASGVSSKKMWEGSWSCWEWQRAHREKLAQWPHLNSVSLVLMTVRHWPQLGEGAANEGSSAAGRTDRRYEWLGEMDSASTRSLLELMGMRSPSWSAYTTRTVEKSMMPYRLVRWLFSVAKLEAGVNWNRRMSPLKSTLQSALAEEVIVWKEKDKKKKRKRPVLQYRTFQWGFLI